METSSCKLNDIFDIKRLLSDKEYQNECAITVSKQGVAYILKYDRKKIFENELEGDLGLFRSVVVDEDGNILCFAPQKSITTNIDISSIFSKYDSNDFWVEEIVEGTMINLFWWDLINDWELTTRSKLGAKSKYNYESKNTFRYMFLEAMNEMKIEFQDFDKKFCYSFILQHPDNKQICPIKEKKIILTNIYTCKDDIVTSVPRKMLHNKDKLKLMIKSPSGDNIVLPKVCYPENSELKEEEFNSLLNSYHNFNFMGYMINLPLKRIKFTNPEYKKVKYLKGNSPRLQYTYFELRKKGKVKEYLRYFPETATIFNTFRNDLHNYTKNLYNCYRSCYIKKEKPVKEFPYEYKTHMYYLHQLYLENYKDNNEYINLSKVISYINNLETPRLLHIINYSWDKYNKNNVN